MMSAPATGDDNTLLFSQEILEQNEDIIAAVVENMQLGRMEDCIQHYSILHKNIISLALALDNFPAGEHSRMPYRDINKFPDEIMRKDILDELRPLGQTKLPKAPLVPVCVECSSKKFSAQKCRTELGHIEPSSVFTTSEAQEFLKVAQLLEHRGRTEKMEPAKPKRVYRVWSPAERFTVFLGISRFGLKGANLLRILDMLPGRNEGQLRSYISKNISEEDMAKALQGVLPPEPEQFIFPPGYTSNSGQSEAGREAGHQGQDQAWQQASSAGQGASRLEPRRGTGDWTALLGIVDGQGGGHVPSPVYSAGVASVGPILPSHPLPHPLSLPHSHAALLPQPLPSIPASSLPPPPLPRLQDQELQLKSQVQAPTQTSETKAPKRKYTKRSTAVAGIEEVAPSKRERKKRGKYKKRNKEAPGASVGAVEMEVAEAMTAAANTSSNISSSSFSKVDSTADTTSKSSQQHPSLCINENSMYFPRAEDGRPQEIILDGLSQFSFDWENSRSGGLADTPDRSSHSRVTWGLGSPLSTRRSLLGRSSGPVIPSAISDPGRSSAGMGGTELEADGGEFSNLINPGDEFSLHMMNSN